jgi:hypothetical protein
VREEQVMISIMLAGAVFASLAVGVLMAYGICQGLFRIFRMHAISVEKERGVVANVSIVSEV